MFDNSPCNTGLHLGATNERFVDIPVSLILNDVFWSPYVFWCWGITVPRLSTGTCASTLFAVSTFTHLRSTFFPLSCLVQFQTLLFPSGPLCSLVLLREVQVPIGSGCRTISLSARPPPQCCNTTSATTIHITMCRSCAFLLPLCRMLQIRGSPVLLAVRCAFW